MGRCVPITLQKDLNSNYQLLLFKSLVDNDLQSAGIGGFILSLIPPTVIFVVVLCVDFNTAVEFCHKVLTSSSELAQQKQMRQIVL